MDRTESLSKLNISNISLSSIRNRTLTSIVVLPNGHLRFEFNRGEPVLLERNMNSVPILNYIESIEVRPFTLTIRTKDGSEYTHIRENEFINYAELPALLTQSIGNLPIFKKMTVSGYFDVRNGQIVPNLGLENMSSGHQSDYYRILNVLMPAGAWRTVPQMGRQVTWGDSVDYSKLVGNNIVLNKGRYLIRLIGAAGISSAAVCFAKYRLFNLTNNTALGYSPGFYMGQSMIYESSSADFSIETLIETDGTQLQLQFRCSVNCRLGANVDWGHRNTLVVTKLD